MGAPGGPRPPDSQFRKPLAVAEVLDISPAPWGLAGPRRAWTAAAASETRRRSAARGAKEIPTLDRTPFREFGCSGLEDQDNAAWTASDRTHTIGSTAALLGTRAMGYTVWHLVVDEATGEL